MKNYVQPGNTLPLTAPSGGVTGGVGYVIGAIFAVAHDAAAQGAEFQGATVGVFALAKSGSLTFTQGEAVFWDNTAKAVKKTATGYFKIGTAIAAVGSSATTINVRLNGTDVVAV
jgi:predicted RecA/RadA family phage recombinase